MRPRLDRVPPVALLVGSVLLFLAPALLRGEMPYGFDTIHEAYPQTRWAYGEIRQGRLPAWNPYVLAGYPFLDDQTTIGVLYPPNLIHLVLPVPISITVSLAAHLILTAFLMYTLQRRLGARREGATLGALAWSLGGFVAGRVFLGELPHLKAVAWAPGILLCMESFVRRPSLRALALGGAAVAASLLAGHIQYGAMGIVAAGLVEMGRMAFAPAGRRGQAARRGVGGLAAMGALGTALAAVQLLPTVALIAESGRSATLEWWQASGPSLPPWQLVTLLAPGFFGDVVETTYWGEFPMELVSPYLGILPLLLVAAGVSWMGPRRTGPWLIVAGVGLILGMGRFTPIYKLLFDTVPLFARLRMPARWLELFVLGTSVLAGMGASWLVARYDEPRPSRSRAPELAALGLAVFLPITAIAGRLVCPWDSFLWFARQRAFVWLVDRPEPDLGFVTNAFPVALTSVAGASVRLLVLAWVFWIGRRRAQAMTGFGWAFPALAAADLLLWGGRFVLPYDVAKLAWNPSILERLAREPGPFRLATHVPMEATPHPQGVLRSYPQINGFSQGFIHMGMTVGIANVAGVFGANPSRYQQLAARGISFEHAFPDRRAVLDLLNTRWILAHKALPREGEIWLGLEPVLDEEDFTLYRNPTALDRAFLVPGVRVVDTLDAALAALDEPAFDPLAAALIERGDLPPGLDLPMAGGGGRLEGARTTIRDYDARRVEVDAHAPGPAVLVLSDLFQDEWRVTLDGEPAPMLRVDVALRGVFLPPGDHIVRFEHFPRRLATGAVVSVSTLAAFAAAWGIVRRRRRMAST